MDGEWTEDTGGEYRDSFAQIRRSVVAQVYITELHFEKVKMPLEELAVAKQFGEDSWDSFKWLE